MFEGYMVCNEKSINIKRLFYFNMNTLYTYSQHYCPWMRW